MRCHPAALRFLQAIVFANGMKAVSKKVFFRFGKSLNPA